MLAEDFLADLLAMQLFEFVIVLCQLRSSTSSQLLESQYFPGLAQREFQQADHQYIQ